MPSGRAAGRVNIKIAAKVWEQEVERLKPGSAARLAAEREGPRLDRDGLPRGQMIRCDDVGTDCTRLPGLFKVYVPISDEPPSQRRFGFVFSLGVEEGRPCLTLVAFGERHPPRGTRTVYERAHKHLHGRFPNQERVQPERSGSSPRVKSPSRGLARGQERGGMER